MGTVIAQDGYWSKVVANFDVHKAKKVSLFGL
jgi:hypothetical protein